VEAEAAAELGAVVRRQPIVVDGNIITSYNPSPLSRYVPPAGEVDLNGEHKQGQGPDGFK
jgi:hypothetical protein